MAAVAVRGFFGYQYWQQRQSALPKGIASGNGRIEAKLVDVAAKEPLRVKEILVDEGALVKPGEVLVRMDTATLEAQLAEARRTSRPRRKRRRSPRQRSPGVRPNRTRQDRGQTQHRSSSRSAPARSGSSMSAERRCKQPRRGLEEEEAKLRTIEQEVKVAQANVATIQTRIDDATLKSPVDGRVLYRLAEVGEVLAAGGKALTLVNLNDVYMEIFLPSEQAARLKIGAEGADYRRLRSRPRSRRLCQLRVPGSAVHSQTGRDAQRARQADVPRQDPGARRDSRIIHRAHQDGRPRRRLRQGG